MKGFLLGMIVGAIGTLWYTQRNGEIQINQRFGEMQDKANAVLNESRRILQETRQELAAALEAGKNTVQQKAERLRRPAGESGDASHSAETEPNQPGT
ncbi:MAG TPA: YtxH domain-containing protein [Chloroflexota bacterium]|nr:YtxH domain-containing protein [Chloroflexota bacterium]